MTMNLNPEYMLSEIEALEAARVDQARQALGQLAIRDVTGQDGMASALSADQRELGALAISQARGGQSVAALQAQEAQRQMAGGNAGRNMREGVALGDRRAQASAQVAGQGGLARAQESAQLEMQGSQTLAADAAVMRAREHKQKQLAAELMALEAENERRSLGRQARKKNAKLGVQTERYASDLSRRDKMKRTTMGGAFQIAASGVAAYADAKKPGGGTEMLPAHYQQHQALPPSPMTAPAPQPLGAPQSPFRAAPQYRPVV